MGKALKIVAILAIVVVGSKLMQKLISTGAGTSANAQVEDMVRELNGQLPKEVTPGLTLTKVELVGSTMRNMYTMDSTVPFDLGKKSIYEANALAQVCGSMKELAKTGITVDFQYNYKESGVPKTFDISVPPGKCV